MTGNPLSEVQTYFGIDPDNGDIFLRELLTNPPRQSYQVITLNLPISFVNLNLFGSILFCCQMREFFFHGRNQILCLYLIFFVVVCVCQGSASCE